MMKYGLDIGHASNSSLVEEVIGPALTFRRPGWCQWGLRSEKLGMAEYLGHVGTVTTGEG